MIHETINLKTVFKTLTNDATLTSYCPDNYDEFSKGRTRKALIVLPGGGYEFLSEREAEPVALRFMGFDIACFVLKYTIAPKIKYPSPVEEVLAAVSYIRKNSDKYHVDTNSISVIGFSAGGHLAASASCYYYDKKILDKNNLTEEETKINGCILCYPVISNDFGHEGTMRCISEGYKEDLLDYFSIEKHVTNKFPKTFFFHTSLDDAVNVENSLALASELHKAGVEFEMHIYPYGQHGLSLADKSVYFENTTKEFLDEVEPDKDWARLAIDFIKRYI